MDSNPFRPERPTAPAPHPRLRLGAFVCALLAAATFGCIGPRHDAAGQPGANGDLRISGGAATLAASQPAAADELQVHFIDVGTGDCIWIHTGDDGIAGNGRLDGLNIIIDGGDNGSFGRIDGYTPASDYLATLLPPGTPIECLILTHPHSDHCGGLVGFLEDYPVRTILDPGFDKTEPGQLPDRLRPKTAYGRFCKTAGTEVDANGTPATFVRGIPDGFTLNWGAELAPKILWSSTEIVDDDLNNVSIVLRLRFTGAGNDAAFLFTGDAEHAVEEQLIASLGDGLKSTVLKAGHHGSNSSTTVSFLERVRPAHVVISSGNQPFGEVRLPRTDTFERIRLVSESLGLGTKLWRTDRDDKEPLLKPVGTEGGDDTVVVRTRGKASDLRIAYAGEETPQLVDATRCQALTQAGMQCKRGPKAGSTFCWQHQDANP